MPDRDELYAAISKRNARLHAEANREIRRFWIGVTLTCLFWAAAGLVCVGWAFHTTDMWLGYTLLYVGQVVTYAGVCGTVGWALHTSGARGYR